MKEKTIKRVLNKKFNDWVKSIDDDQVKICIAENTIITGGCFPSLMKNEKPNDYDVYFRNKESALIVAKYYVKKFNENHGYIERKIGGKTKAYVIDGSMIEKQESEIIIKDPELSLLLGGSHFLEGNFAEGNFGLGEVKKGMSRMIGNIKKDRIKIYASSDGIAKDENYYEDKELDLRAAEAVISELDDIDSEIVKEEEKYQPVFLTTNAITLSNKIQIVIRFYGSPFDIHETYDFAHTKGYWTSWDNELVIPREVYEAVMNKVLIYTGSKYPVCSMFRVRKFVGRGWSINAGQILKIAFQISELDLTNIDVLEDQLIGVDSLYFMNLIHQLRQRMDKDPEWVYSESYLVSIIDKIF